MNLDRKIRMQERTIQSLRDKNKKLESENEALHLENAELSDKVSHYEHIIGDTNSWREEWNKNIQEAISYKMQYKETVFAIRKIRNDYEKKLKQLNKKFKV